jgi:hypothetical protein
MSWSGGVISRGRAFGVPKHLAFEVHEAIA